MGLHRFVVSELDDTDAEMLDDYLTEQGLMFSHTVDPD